MKISQLAMHKLLRHAWLVTSLIISIILGMSMNSDAATKYLEHRLSISFDLAENRLMGVSNIELPPNVGIDVQLGNLNILQIAINGEETDLVKDENILSVSPTNGSQNLTITYKKQISSPESQSSGIISSEGIALTGMWHPLIDQDILFSLVAEIPAEFEAISEAERITTKVLSSNKKEVRFHFPHPLEGINFVAGPYVVSKVAFGDNKELYTYFFKEDAELAKKYQQKTFVYLDRYEKILGEYPFKRFSVVENRLPTGFAMPTFTLLGQAVVRLPFIPDTSLGHEVLHAWFGNAVRVDAEQGNWAEGLTAYLADQSFARDKKEDTVFRKQQLIKYQSYVNKENKLALKDFGGGYSHLDPIGKNVRAVGYEKGSMLFHMLSKKLGEELFIKGLQDFITNNKYQKSSWTNLRESFEKISETSLVDFFEQWLERDDVPNLKVQNLKIEEKEGQPVFSFQLIQTQEKPYSLDVPIKILTPKEEIDKVVSLTERKTDVEIPADFPPTKLIIDQNYDLMRHLSPNELPPAWSHFRGASNKVAVLISGEKADIYKPLVEQLEAMDCMIVDEDDVSDADLVDASVIFLGADSSLARSLFAQSDHPSSGVTVDIRTSPLNPDEVVILVSAENKEEAAKVSRKLIHYGKYSYLHFKNGIIKEKTIKASDMGMHYVLDVPPQGVEIVKKLTFDDIVQKLESKRVVYVGETHTRNEDHQLQLRVLRAMYYQNPKLAIGMEMFPRSVQEVLDEYIANDMDEWEFLKKVQYFKNWGYDYRFYRDIINFAKHNKIPIVALNLEKDIVSKVFKEGGISALSEEEIEKIPEDRKLDIEGYRDRLVNVFSMHGKTAADPSKINDFFQAQAIWDETMAESAVNYLKDNPDGRMIVVAGQGHTGKDSGIPPRVIRRLPLEQAVVLNAQPMKIGPEVADFLVFSPENTLPKKPLLGVSLVDTDNGVTVAQLSPHGMAGKSGVKEKDIITAIDDEPVGTVNDLKIVMLYKKRGEKVRVRITRPRAIFADKKVVIEVPL